MSFNTEQINEILESYIDKESIKQNRSLLGYTSARLEVSSFVNGDEETKVIEITSTSEPIVFDFTTAKPGDVMTVNAQLIISTGTTDLILYEGNSTFSVNTGINSISLKMVKKILEISFNPNGGTGVMDVVTLQYSESCLLPSCTFTRENYHFVGWSTVSDSLTPTYLDGANFLIEDSDVVLYAIWSDIDYNVITFDANGGTGTMDPLVLDYGVSGSLTINKFTKAGYTFVGWALEPDAKIVKYGDGADIVNRNIDLLLYAVWTLGEGTQYTVEHYKENITCSGYDLITEDTKVLTGITNSNVVYNEKVYNGFTFTDALTESPGIINADGSSVVKLYYKRNTVTLYFTLNNGQKQIPITGKYGTTTSNPGNPLKEGYNFTCWSPSYPETFPVEDTTYTAQWEGKSYNITLMLAIALDQAGKIYTTIDYAEGYTPPETYTAGVEIALPDVCDLALSTGEVLEGWYEDEEFLGEPVTKIDSSQIGDKIYYAKTVDGFCGTCVEATSYIETLPSIQTLINYKVVVTSINSDTELEDLRDEIAGITSSLITISLDLSYSELEEIGVEFFSDCTALSSIVLPKNLSTIGDGAFSGCDSFRTIKIPSSVTSIGEGAFFECSSLTDIIVEEGNSNYKDINGVLFTNSEDTLVCYPSAKSDFLYTIPDAVVNISDYAFSICNNLYTVLFGPKVESIGNSAFSDCSNLLSIIIPNSLETIGNSSFSSCTKLFDVKLGSNVQEIGVSAFEGCSALTSITIPSSVIYIGAGAFGSTGLTELIFEDINTWYYVKNLGDWDDAISNNVWTAVGICGFSYGTLTTNADNYVDNLSSYFLHKEQLSVTYDANGATSGTVPTVQYKEYGVDLIISENTGLLAKEGEHFIGWCTSANGRGNFYQEGASYSTDCTKPVTLYAQWITTAEMNLLTEVVNEILDGEDGSFGTGGKYVYFGDYPQTIKDSTVAVTKTTETIQGREYHLGSDGYYYVKVTAKPFKVGYTFSDGTPIESGMNYYFKVEPIKWARIADDYKDVVNTSCFRLLLAEKILDCCEYFGDERKGIIQNSYECSTVRAFLNGIDGSSYGVDDFSKNSFLINAFTETAINKIIQPTLDNTVESMAPLGNDEWKNSSFVCNNTSDRIFLLSTYEATSSTYGFNTEQVTDSLKQRKPTDYAIALGVFVTNNETYSGNSHYYLRSPYFEVENSVAIVAFNGKVEGHECFGTDVGILPALTIKY